MIDFIEILRHALNWIWSGPYLSLKRPVVSENSKYMRYVPQRLHFRQNTNFIYSFLKLQHFLYRAVIAQLVYRWATGWTIGVLGFDSRRGLGFFLFSTASRTALGPTQPPIQWVPGALSLGVKRPGRKADHSPPSAEVKNAWSYTSTPPIRLHGEALS
jgi:hypothetical protein